MGRLFRILLILLCYVLGVVLVFVPWSGRFWERNPLLERYPALRPYVLNPYLRGAVSGLGVLDVLIAISALRRRLDAPSGENSAPAAS
ncbi:MAG: hypothetical protein K6U09_00355 [Acidobacteriia bacterium]|jgi:hypothetical protein|nr:hypothetical protein [Terriglobia bacterium]